MKLAIITLVKHSVKDVKYYGYGPYVREMNLWGRYVDKIEVLGMSKPDNKPSGMDASYDHSNISLTVVPDFNILTFSGVLKSFMTIPVVFYRICKIMRQADHIHLRCPANVSLVACIAQVFFPKKNKSTKYAGNWDPNSDQPWTYRLQQAILRNKYLTKNMQVLVYGEWPNEPAHVKPFISATFYDHEKVSYIPRDYNKPLKLVFAASMVVGKRPMLTIQIVERLNQLGYPAVLHMFGDGPLMPQLRAYTKENQLEKWVVFYGNQDITKVKEQLLDAHFNILPSKSEGWPKAVAEGMFFGCVPITTRVSCVGWMIGEGTRGIIIEPELEQAVTTIVHHLKNEDLNKMAQKAMTWSQEYTFDRLELDIKKVLNKEF